MLESIRLVKYYDGSEHVTTFTGKQVEIAATVGVDVPLEWMSPTVRKEYERKRNPKKRSSKSKKNE